MLIIRSIVQVILAIIEILLLLRLIFVFLNASAVGFAAWIFSWSAPFLTPFSGIFPTLGEIFLIIVAMIIYAVIGALLTAVFSLGA